MEREKQRVAVVSVIGAVVLALSKFWVGWLTGSLGMLAEGLHSLLDLLASLVTLGAVRVADRPPDREHPYGHGRVENLAAMLQALLLLGLAGWVAVESVGRLFFRYTPVEVTVWSFAVMIGSILIDYGRSTALMRTARKYRSQALQADALNFRADMWSSATVLAGLGLVAWSHRGPGFAWLERADAAAALVVSLLVVGVAARLGLRSLQVLVDRAPEGLEKAFRQAAERVPGVLSVGAVRVRESGSRILADLTVTVSRGASLEQAHRVAEAVEGALERAFRRTDVVVHVEPTARAGEPPAEGVRAVALRMGLRTHDEQVHRVGESLEVSLHLELDPSFTLSQAHDVADALEAALKEEYPAVVCVSIHLEPALPSVGVRREVTGEDAGRVESIRRLAEEAGRTCCREVRLFRAAQQGRDPVYDVLLRCSFLPGSSLEQIHERTEKVEQALRFRYPDLVRVVIQAEPGAESRGPGKDGAEAD